MRARAVSQESWQLLGKPLLSTCDKQPFGPARNPLQVLGQYKGHLSYKGRASTQQVFVVKGLKNNLLGFPAITALNLVARVDETSSSETTTTFTDRILEKFPQVFQGLGNLGEEYEIKLKPEAKPYPVYTLRHIPLPLWSKVTEELNRMEEMGVISKVTEPTSWCAGMVVVPKKSGAIWICVDLKPLPSLRLLEGTASISSPSASQVLLNTYIWLTYGELELLICLHFPMAETGTNKEGVSL